jgi:hypothetical protein
MKNCLRKIRKRNSLRIDMISFVRVYRKNGRTDHRNEGQTENYGINAEHLSDFC